MRLRCRCDHVLIDDGSPSKFKAHARPDCEDARYANGIAVEAERIARDHAAAPPERRELKLRTALQEIGMVGVHLERAAYECPSCGRLVLTLADGGVQFYLPEGDERGVFAR